MSATVVIIPARNDLPWYNFKSTIAGVVYTLRFRFNIRMNRWILDIADSQNNDLLNGIPLLLGRNLTERFVTEGLPPGFFFVVDDTGQETQPTRLSFGTTHTLWFYDETGQT